MDPSVDQPDPQVAARAFQRAMYAAAAATRANGDGTGRKGSLPKSVTTLPRTIREAAKSDGVSSPCWREPVPVAAIVPGVLRLIAQRAAAA